MGLLDYITRGGPGYSGGLFTQGDTGQANAYDTELDKLPLTDDYWRALGYQGPVSVQGSGDSGTLTPDPELMQWLQTQGLQTGNQGATQHNALIGPGNVKLPGSEYGTASNDDATFIAGMLGIGGVGYLANAAGLGVDAAGNATGGAFGGSNTGNTGNGPAPAGGNTGMLETMGQEAVTIPQVPAGPTGTVGGNGLLGKAAEVGAGTVATKAGGWDDTAADPYGQDSGYGKDTLPAMGQPDDTAADPWASLRNYAGSAQDWLKENPQAGRTLAGLLGGAVGASGGSSGGGGYVDSGYRPTITRGGFMAQSAPQTQPAKQRPSGLLTMPQGPGYANSGLWRYGLLGGGK